MVKLIINLPDDTNAELLMTIAVALANYKARHPYQFNLKPNSVEHYTDYEAVDLIEPDSVWRDTVHEYEVSGDLLDPFLMEVLSELQQLIPFEMHFENRGKYDRADWLYSGDNAGDIKDNALHRLFWEGATA